MLKIQNCGNGLNLDAMPSELADGQWTDGLNMRFRDDCTERFRGMQTAYNTPSITPYWIGLYTTNTKRFAVYAGTGKVYADDGTTATEITRYTEGGVISSITRTAQTISSITRVSPTVASLLCVSHGRAAGDTFTVSGATPAAYNGTFTIATVTDANNFTFAPLSDPAVDASVVGTISQVATVTTATAHGRARGDAITIYGASPAAYNGTFVVTSAPLSTTLKFSLLTEPGSSATTMGEYTYNVTSNFTGAQDDRWTGSVLNGVLVLNNGVDVPQYWNGDTSLRLRKLTGWPSGWKVDSLKAVSYFLVGVGLTRNSVKETHTVVWSDAAEPGAIPTAWTASDTNLAGDQSIVSSGAMVDTLFWNDINFIFKQDAVWAQRFISGNDVFQFSQLPGSGMVARGCAAATPKGIVILAPGDVVLNNGLQEISLTEGRIRKALSSLLDSTYLARAFVTTNPKYKEVWLCFPTTGQTSCNKAAVWNWESDTWTFRSLSGVTYGTAGLIATGLSVGAWTSGSDTWNSAVSAWTLDGYAPNEERLILSRNSPDISLVDTGTKDFGVAINWSLERTGLNENDTDSVKIISRSRPLVIGTAGTVFSVYHGSAQTPDATPSYGGAITYTVGTSVWANGFANGGRYLAYKLTGSDVQPIRFRTIDLDAKAAGSF